GGAGPSQEQIATASTTHQGPHSRPLFIAFQLELHHMKVAILNYSGSVGKTVTASHLLAPRMHGAQIFAIESTNETAGDLGLDIDMLRGEQFGKLFRDLLAIDDAIVDVGA